MNWLNFSQRCISRSFCLGEKFLEKKFERKIWKKNFQEFFMKSSPRQNASGVGRAQVTSTVYVCYHLSSQKISSSLPAARAEGAMGEAHFKEGS